jgi:hypothetical protein
MNLSEIEALLSEHIQHQAEVGPGWMLFGVDDNGVYHPQVFETGAKTPAPEWAKRVVDLLESDLYVGSGICLWNSRAVIADFRKEGNRVTQIVRIFDAFDIYPYLPGGSRHGSTIPRVIRKYSRGGVKWSDGR